MAAELLLIARRHVTKLNSQERRRFLELVRRGRLRRGRLTERERRELSRLIHKMEPREFFNNASKKLVGVSLPGSGGSGKAGARHD